MRISTAAMNEIKDGAEKSHSIECRPPKYIINLSLPPADRYKHLAQAYRDELCSLPGLFDEIIHDLSPKLSITTVRWLARRFLRRLHDREETEELRGIQQVTGIEMYLLVAFNVLLDLFMGCTSGGVRVSSQSGTTKMLHFRTLDWGMDSLRKIVVHLDFVKEAGGDVVASSITYVGFVGVLTGIKKASIDEGSHSLNRDHEQKPLSMSLNFRPTHDSSKWYSNLRFYMHHLSVLLGWAPSVSSLLRQCLLPYLYSTPMAGQSPSLSIVEQRLRTTKTTAAYLIFSDGDRTITVEQDYGKAVIKSSGRFVVTCNHDALQEKSEVFMTGSETATSDVLKVTGMEDLVAESISRKKMIQELWKASQQKQTGASFRELSKEGFPIATKKLFGWVNTYPITNEETHFAVVMDPKAGEIIWVNRYLTPIQ